MVYPPSLSYVTFVITIVSFIITSFNLIALYAEAVTTIRGAPTEIRDILGNIRQEISEERAALRRKMRSLRASKRNSNNIAGQTLTEQTLRLHHVTMRDIWREFRRLERPFLVSGGFRAEQIRKGHLWGENDLDENVRKEYEKFGEDSSENWTAYYKCDLSHRFIWWQSKSEVMKLADMISRIIMRRISREVDDCRLMLKQIGDGGQGPRAAGLVGFYDDGGGGGGGGGGRDGGDGAARRRPRSRVTSATAATAAAAAAAAAEETTDSESDRPRRQSNTARRRDDSAVVERRRRQPQRGPPPPESDPPDYDDRDTRRQPRRQETEWEVVRPSQRREGGVRVIEIDVPPGREIDIERGQRPRSRYDSR